MGFKTLAFLPWKPSTFSSYLDSGVLFPLHRVQQKRFSLRNPKLSSWFSVTVGGGFSLAYECIHDYVLRTDRHTSVNAIDPEISYFQKIISCLNCRILTSFKRPPLYKDHFLWTKMRKETVTTTQKPDIPHEKLNFFYARGGLACIIMYTFLVHSP